MRATHLPFLVFAAALAAGAGCDADPAEERREARDPAARAERAVEMARVTWPERARLDEAVLARLRPEARAAVARAPVPVLVPAEGHLLDAATVMAKAHWYALSARASGVTVSVSATRLAYRYPHIAPVAGDRVVRGARGFVTVNEGIRSATWIEQGVSYTIEVECDAAGDARCADDAYLLELAERLAYVGGAGAEEAAP